MPRQLPGAPRLIQQCLSHVLHCHAAQFHPSGPHWHDLGNVTPGGMDHVVPVSQTRNAPRRIQLQLVPVRIP